MDTKRIVRKIGIVLILGMSLVSFLIGISTAKASSLETTSNPKLDVRLVIDVSANMKKQDPEGSRVMALQKMIRSIPHDSRSGIWTYGKQVNMLVPFGNVDTKWKKAAIYKVATINAFGDYRNIDDAINKAAYGWQNKSPYKKYMIIVTNGDLKISPSKVKNAKSQLQLLTTTLTKLKSANIELHTISFGDDADNRLLKILAYETNGKWYSVADAKLLSGVLNHAYKNIIAKAQTSNIDMIANAKSHNKKNTLKSKKDKFSISDKVKSDLSNDVSEKIANSSTDFYEGIDDEELVSSSETNKFKNDQASVKKISDTSLLAVKKFEEVNNSKLNSEYTDVAYMDELDKINSTGTYDSMNTNSGNTADSVDLMNDVDSMGYMNSGEKVNPINERASVKPPVERAQKPDSNFNKGDLIPVKGAGGSNQLKSAPIKSDNSLQQPKTTPHNNGSAKKFSRPSLKDNGTDVKTNKQNSKNTPITQNLPVIQNKSKADDEMDFNWPTVYSD